MPKLQSASLDNNVIMGVCDRAVAHTPSRCGMAPAGTEESEGLRSEQLTDECFIPPYS